MSSLAELSSGVSAVTADRICRGALDLLQPRDGYRFNLDAVLLAGFVVARQRPAPRRVVDLGAGCGVIGLLLARAWPECRVVLVELQHDLAELARRNAERNGLAERVAVVEGDLRETDLWSSVGPAGALLVSNPPFFPPEAGRVSARPTVAVAKHEVHCSLVDLLGAASGGLVGGGELALIHTASRKDDVLAGLAQHALRPECVRMVLPYTDRPPTRALFLASRDPERFAASSPTRSASATCCEEPLVVHRSPGIYSSEVCRWLGSNDSYGMSVDPGRAHLFQENQ